MKPILDLMNTFRADELLLTFDELKPFSDVLHDELQVLRLHKVYKSLDKYDDDSLIRHVLVLVALMENYLQSDLLYSHVLQSHLVELGSVIERAKSSVSKDYVSIAVGILLKYSAVLLSMRPGCDAEVCFILYSLAYQNLSSVSLDSKEVSAWVAMHILEASAAITCADVCEDRLMRLWSCENLSQYCVDRITPHEEHVQKLRAGAVEEGLKNSFKIWPAITIQRIEHLFKRLVPVLHRPEVLRLLVWMIGHDNTFEEMSLFDELLMSSPVEQNSELSSTTLTSTDVKVFLYTLSVWSESASHPAKVPARLRIRAGQVNCWKAICQLINNSADADDVKLLLLRSRVIESVRLRHRVVSLKRLYEVFRWLEVNEENEAWQTLYATTISDVITGNHPLRKKCDDLFPDGVGEDEDLTVDEVDCIEEHVSRYLASCFLIKGEFREAEQKLVSANSIPSKKLLIKVYQSWMEDDNLKGQQREQLTKRIAALEAECNVADAHLDTPTSASPTSFDSSELSEAYNGHSSFRRTQADASTNTPARSDFTAQSDVAEESFFSVKSAQTDVVFTDKSSGNAAASPLTKNGAVGLSKPGDSTFVNESRSGGKAQTEVSPKDPLATSVLSMSAIQSISFVLPAASQTQEKGMSLSEGDSGQSSALSKPQVQSQPTVVNAGPTTLPGLVVSTAPAAISPTVPAIAATSPFGKFITSKEAATSFWKSGKSAGALFGTVPPCLQPKDGGAHQSSISANKAATSTSNSPRSAPSFSPQRSSSVNSSQVPSQATNVRPSNTIANAPKDVEKGKDVLPAVTPAASSKPLVVRPLPPHSHEAVMEDLPDDVAFDDNFNNALTFEMCEKKLKTMKKTQSASVDDMSRLEQKVAQMKLQLENIANQPPVKPDVPSQNSTIRSSKAAPTTFESIRHRQGEELVKLEQLVAQIIRPEQQQSDTSFLPAISGGSKPDNKELATKALYGPAPSSTQPSNISISAYTASSSTAAPSTNATSGAHSRGYVDAWTSYGSPQVTSLLNPLQKMEQLARHPGSSGVCLGCLDDDSQDRALQILQRLIDEWNAASDSDSD